MYKEPDTVIVLIGAPMPMITVEVGYTESWPKFLRDEDLWINGEAPHVNAVLLVKWNLTKNNLVASFLELRRRGAPSPSHLTIFPALPPGASAQTLAWQRRDFYPVGQVHLEIRLKYAYGISGYSSRRSTSHSG
ncbi:hypothetical protein ABOM_007493 [Aspergillus bombycis]|uniref:Uncharacterized protein n=1 Tax=Aspergillus bombycis TaxID=109264 RepID=A0A1F7ZV23_9EURO|nr:hypothetical protein ABOM_007493 [Aspergillus bombycis]OGM42928.1 hypothetical protein ABOM_007493 [Aspergillus bombycis]